MVDRDLVEIENPFLHLERITLSEMCYTLLIPWGQLLLNFCFLPWNFTSSPFLFGVSSRRVKCLTCNSGLPRTYIERLLLLKAKA